MAYAICDMSNHLEQVPLTQSAETRRPLTGAAAWAWLRKRSAMSRRAPQLYVVNSKYGDMVMEVSMNYHQRHTVSIEL